MSLPGTSVFDMVSVLINALITLMSVYAAWTNLIRSRISVLGFDALILGVIGFFDQRQAQSIRQNPKLIRRLGIFMLAFALGCAYAAIMRFSKSILPFLS